MQKKLLQFYVLKFSSRRLREAKYQIDLSLSQARRNGEVVSLGDSELLRLIRRIKNKTLFSDTIDRLMQERQIIKSRDDSKENRFKLLQISNNIDDILFVPEIIIVHFDNVAHYKSISNNGLCINGRWYTRLMAGAGHARRASAIFCDITIYDELMTRLNNGRNPDLEMNAGKFQSYFALVSSATHSVSTPRFTVIPDYEFEKYAKMDMMVESHTDGVDHEIKEIDGNYTKNAFDGQGLISTTWAQKWAEELGLDYVPSHWVFRGVFMKGGLVTFPTIDFAIENNAFMVKDIWGNEQDIFNLDVILSASQFKLASGYTSLDEYIENCWKNGFGWGISRYSPKEEKRFSLLNYQFIQVLNLDTPEKIAQLCQPTVDWLKDVMGGDPTKTLLYLLGELTNKIPDAGWFNKLDASTRAILLEPQLVREPAIHQAIVSSLRKKIRGSYIGKLIVRGNYQSMISDPVAQMQWALGLQPKGILQEGECYSRFWVNAGVNRISTLRAPMTWRSEINVMHAINTKDTDKWFGNISSGVIMNIHDDSPARMSGADFDGDMCLSTNQKEFIEDIYGGNLVSYNRTTASKGRVNDAVAWHVDVQSMTNRIGFITNIGTTYFSMLPLYANNKLTKQKIINRLKLLCCFQSMEIDKTKGIKVVPFPLWWTKWSATTGDITPEEKELAHQNNEILADKRPYFFRHLYPRYDKEYQKHVGAYQNYCRSKFGLSLEEVMADTSNEYQKKITHNFVRFSPLIDSSSVMNMLSHHMEAQVALAKSEVPAANILRNLIPEELDEEKLSKMSALYKRFTTAKKESLETDRRLEHIIQDLRKEADEITSSGLELAHLAIRTNQKFALQVFGDEVILFLMTIFDTRVVFPVLDEKGEVPYLGGRYKKILLDIS